MNEKKVSKANNCGGVKMVSQDEQQNQTTATTKFIYIKNFMSVSKNKT